MAAGGGECQHRHRHEEAQLGGPRQEGQEATVRLKPWKLLLHGNHTRNLCSGLKAVVHGHSDSQLIHDPERPAGLHEHEPHMPSSQARGLHADETG